jgi:hypothetical protein
MNITWHDLGRGPQSKPDPRWPEGIGLDCSSGAGAACKVDLPYPARRCGFHENACEVCGIIIAVSTAGRPDDPRSVTIACRGKAEKST